MLPSLCKIPSAHVAPSTYQFNDSALVSTIIATL